MKLKRILASIFAVCMLLSSIGFNVFAEEANETAAATAVAKVGNTEYASIDEAIANWTNGTTLTLLSNVTLTDVIKLSSTEYHILDLGTYTMTAAKNKDAIQYVVNGRSSASYALDIKADATNPGGITATGGSVVRHTKPLTGAPSKDRPITRFYGGVFNASYVVRQGGTFGAGYTGASAPAFYFYGGEYNGTIYTNRSINQFYGGTFNGSMQMSVDSSAYTQIAGGTFKNLSNSMGSDLTTGDKFTIGSAKGANNGSVCIDENGYYVITTTTPTAAEASVASNYNSNNYFYYSTVNTNGMYYEDVYDALEANKTGTVTVFIDELDLTDSSFTGTIVVPEGETITVIVEEGVTPTWTLNASDESVTYEDAEGNELVKNEDGSITALAPDTTIDSVDELVNAITDAESGDTIVIGGDITSDSLVVIEVNKNLTITGNVMQRAAGGAVLTNIGINAVEECDELTVSNLTFAGNSWINSGAANKLTVSGVTANVTPNNTTYTNSRSAFISLGRNEGQNLELVVENSSIVANGGADPILGWAAITEATITGNTFGSAAAYQANSDSVKFMAIADGAVLNVTGNTVYSNYNGIVFGQNTTRDNAYTVNIDNNHFYGNADHIWVEISGGDTCHATIKATSQNTVNGEAFTANDIKAHTSVIKKWSSYMGVDVETDADGKVIGGQLAFAADDAVADGYDLDENGYVVASAPSVTYVAKIGETSYTTLEEAFKAATEGCTIEILADVVIDYKWDCRDYATNGSHSQFKESVTINGNEHTIKFTDTISDGNWNTVFRFEENATVNNLTVDISNATGVQRVISAKKSLSVDGLTIIGSAKYGIIFGEGADVTDLAVAEIVIKNSTLTGTRRAISDNEGGKDVKSVTISYNQLYANAYASASETIVFNNNVAKGEVDLRSYAAENVLSVVAKNNNLTEGVKNYIYAKTIDAQDEFTANRPAFKVSTKAELNAAIAAAQDGDTIILTADIDYGTDQLKIEEAITFDLGGFTLTTRNAYGGMSVKNNPTIKNGTIVHASNTAAIKVWNAAAFEDLVIDVQGKGDANKTIGGIVLQSGSTTRVGSIKNVTIKGAALTNGIETYNCGDATAPVIGSMENVTIDAVGTAMNISAPVGTATGCTFKGGENGIKLWIKGTYSASLDLVDCDVVGDVYVHDEFASNVTNNGTLTLTVDEATTGVTADTVTLTLNHAEESQVIGEVLDTIIENAQAKVNGTYYATLAEAIAAAKAGDKVTVFAGTYAVPSMKAGITIEGEVNTDGTPAVHFEGTLSGTLDNLTLKNIHIKGGNAQRWAYAKGDLVFENVTFEATSVYALHFDGIAAGTNLTYKDCTIIGWAAMGGSPASCTFDGCTIKGNGTYGVIRTYFDATIKNCTFDVDNVNTNDGYQDGIHAVDATIKVYGSTNADGDIKDVLNISGASKIYVDDVLALAPVVATAGGVEYFTLTDAIEKAGTNTIVLIADVTENITTIADGATVVIDLGGKTLNGYIAPCKPASLTISNGFIKNTNADNSAIEINAGVLTLTDVEIESARHAVRIDGVVDATINGGTYKGGIGGTVTLHAVNASGGANVTIESGDFYGPKGTIADSGAAVMVQANTTVIINGGSFSNGKNNTLVAKENAVLTVYGGTFDQDPSAYVAEGYAALLNLDDQYVVGEKPTATVNNLGAMTISDYSVYGGSLSGDLPLSFVMQFLANQDAEDMATSPYADWYGDFVLTFTGIENGSFTADGCYLAGFYGDFGWVVIPVDGMTIEDGVRYPVMLGVGMGQKYDYICESVKDFRCALYITPEILEANPDIQVSLELSVVDNSKGEDAAANALADTSKKYVNVVGETTYDAEDFVTKTYVAQIGYTCYETLAEAIAAAQDGDTVVLTADIALDTTVKVNANITLDLNGKTITGTDNATGSFALIEVQPGKELTIDDTSDEKTGKITLESTNNRGWNAYSSVISNQRGKLTVNGGTIEHLGGTDMAYGIDNLTNGKGTYAETIIEDGTVKSTYRAIRQFLNGVEAQNILTVNGGTIEGANKSIWMQDPSKNANSGTLTVGENAKLIGDVYLFVTEGSTEWPVTVSIVSAAIVEGSTVISANVPAGYVVENNNGTYGVIAEKPLFNFYSTSMSLESSLALNIFFNAANLEGENYYALVEHIEEDGTVRETKIPYEKWENRDGNKVISYTGIAAKEMADEIKVTVYTTDDEQASVTLETSIRKLLISYIKFEENNSPDSPWLTVYVDMLNYGTAAQKMLKYNEDDYANKGAEEYQEYATKEDFALNKDGCTVSGTGISGNLTLESMIKFNVFFAAETYFTGSTDGMYATYTYTTYNGTEVNKRIDFSDFELRGNKYCVSVSDIAIANTDTLFTVILHGADGEEKASITYSVNAYLKVMQDAGDNIDMCQALAKLGASAKKAFKK